MDPEHFSTFMNSEDFFSQIRLKLAEKHIFLIFAGNLKKMHAATIKFLTQVFANIFILVVQLDSAIH